MMYACLFPGIKVTVTSDYEAEEDGELTLHQGETLVVLEQPDNTWWMGYKAGRLGYFPSSCVQVNTVRVSIEFIHCLDILGYTDKIG